MLYSDTCHVSKKPSAPAIGSDNGWLNPHGAVIDQDERRQAPYPAGRLGGPPTCIEWRQTMAIATRTSAASRGIWGPIGAPLTYSANQI